MLRSPVAVSARLKCALLLSVSASVLMGGEQALAQAAAPAAPLPTTAAATPDANAVQEVVVTGSRLVTGATPPPPLSTVTNVQLQSRGAVNLSDTVQEIPAFRPTAGQSQGLSGALANGQSLLDLRGLGRTRTLVLVDGQRPTPTNTDGSFDTNTIPTSLVARTDVVTGGASAAYGSDAVAGVVNFVLKDKIDGFIGNAQYGISNYADTRNRSGSLGWGHEFDDGKVRVMMGGDLSKTDPSPTMYGRPWGALEPGIIPLTATRPAGTPATLITNHVEYILPPQGLITSCVVGGKTLSGSACPVGNLTFQQDGTPVPFQYGPYVGTTVQVAPSNSTDYGYTPLGNLIMQSGGQKANFLARVAYDISPTTSAWAQYSYGSFKIFSESSYFTRSANAEIINAGNPYIPAALAAQMAAGGITQIKMASLLPNAYNPQNINSFHQEQAGLKGTLFGDWKWDFTATDGASTFMFRNHNFVSLANYYSSIYAVKDSSGNTVCGPLSTNPNASMLTAPQIATIGAGCAPTNLFGLGNQSAAAQAYDSTTFIVSTLYKRQSAEFNFGGTLFHDWAGPVSLAVGAEWHRDKVDFVVDPSLVASSAAQDFPAYAPVNSSGKTSAKEVYAEVGVPVMRDAMFFKALDLNGAVRHTDYSPSGPVNTWKLGGTWDVNDFLRLRLTRSRDIRAPNIAEAFLQSGSFGILTNPLTGVSAQQGNTNFGNPNLKPEVADTWTGGFVVSPTSGLLSGFRASVDYYNIRINGVIASISAAQVLQRYYVQNNQSYAQYITFNPNNPLGFDHVTSALLNLNTQQTSGYDIDIEYRAPRDALGVPGRFSVTAQGNRLHQLETYDNTGASLGEIAGYFPRNRWTFYLNYDYDKFGGYLQARYSSSMKYNINDFGPDSQYYNPALPNSINKNIFPSVVYWSIGGHYTVVDAGNRHLELYGIIDNLLNKNPPSGSYGALMGMGTGGTGGYDPYDNIGRYFKMGFRFTY